MPSGGMFRTSYPPLQTLSNLQADLVREWQLLPSDSLNFLIEDIKLTLPGLRSRHRWSYSILTRFDFHTTFFLFRCFRCLPSSVYLFGLYCNQVSQHLYDIRLILVCHTVLNVNKFLPVVLELWWFVWSVLNFWRPVYIAILQCILLCFLIYSDS